MRIEWCSYELISSFMRRNGALLRIHFSDGSIGHADCHPWQELGDESLEKQLKYLTVGKTTSLTEQSLFFAKIDAEARVKHVNLLKDKQVPESHYLVMDLKDSIDTEKILSEGFQVFKFKVGRQIAQELILLKKFLPVLPRVRLDFNCRLSFQSFLSFMDDLKTYWEKIEFCEDPFPFDEALWIKASELTGISLALDRFSKVTTAAKFQIMKPAIESSKQIYSQKLVVTSYLSHPFEQVCAAYIAAQLNTEICGLQSHYIYEKNAFSEELSAKGPHFQPPSGTGFGFDQLLQQCVWRTL